MGYEHERVNDAAEHLQYFSERKENTKQTSRKTFHVGNTLSPLAFSVGE